MNLVDERIQHTNAVASRKEFIRYETPDEPGAASDQNMFHSPSRPSRMHLALVRAGDFPQLVANRSNKASSSS